MVESRNTSGVGRGAVHAAHAGFSPAPEVAAAHDQADLHAGAVRLGDFFSNAGDDFRGNVVHAAGAAQGFSAEFQEDSLIGGCGCVRHRCGFYADKIEISRGKKKAKREHLLIFLRRAGDFHLDGASALQTAGGEGEGNALCRKAVLDVVGKRFLAVQKVVLQAPGADFESQGGILESGEHDDGSRVIQAELVLFDHFLQYAHDVFNVAIVVHAQVQVTAARGKAGDVAHRVSYLKSKSLHRTSWLIH